MTQTRPNTHALTEEPITSGMAGYGKVHVLTHSGVGDARAGKFSNPGTSEQLMGLAHADLAKKRFFAWIFIVLCAIIM